MSKKKVHKSQKKNSINNKVNEKTSTKENIKKVNQNSMNEPTSKIKTTTVGETTDGISNDKKDGQEISSKERGDYIQRLQMSLVVTVCAIILLIALFMSSVILNRSEAAMKKRCSELIAANSHQLQMNINSYLDKVESTAGLLFADESYYTYDATNPTISEYDKIKTQEEISDRIVDIGLMQNFSDFGIVYRDDETVGWVSKGTLSLFKDKDMFTTFEQCITNDRTQDGWAFGVKGNQDRFYYVKRLNLNALLVASFYGKELSSVFEFPEEIEDMTISLADENHAILYSSDEDKIGMNLSDKLEAVLKDSNNVVAMDDTILMTANSCENGWLVVCSVPMTTVLKESKELGQFVIIFTVLMVIIFIIASVIVLRKIANPVSGIVSDLQEQAEHDTLSGVLNKASYTNQVKENLTRKGEKRYTALMILDADNFKQINDRLGHAHGDDVIKRIGKLLQQFEDPRTTIGRIGGDEFSVAKEFSNVTLERAQEYVDVMLEQLLMEFDAEFEEEHLKCDLTLSAGVTISVGNADSFETLFEQADAALYVSKRSGKHQYTWYHEHDEDQGTDSKEGMKSEK